MCARSPGPGRRPPAPCAAGAGMRPGTHNHHRGSRDTACEMCAYRVVKRLAKRYSPHMWDATHGSYVPWAAVPQVRHLRECSRHWIRQEGVVSPSPFTSGAPHGSACTFARRLGGGNPQNVPSANIKTDLPPTESVGGKSVLNVYVSTHCSRLYSSPTE